MSSPWLEAIDKYAIERSRDLQQHSFTDGLRPRERMLVRALMALLVDGKISPAQAIDISDAMHRVHTRDGDDRFVSRRVINAVGFGEITAVNTITNDEWFTAFRRELGV